MQLINPHSRYVRLDAYLQQYLCHMTSDVKFSQMIFFLFTLFKRLILRRKRTFIIKQIVIFLKTKSLKTKRRLNWNQTIKEYIHINTFTAFIGLSRWHENCPQGNYLQKIPPCVRVRVMVRNGGNFLGAIFQGAFFLVRDESSSVSNNIKLQIFQKYFQNVQLFSLNRLNALIFMQMNWLRIS